LLRDRSVVVAQFPLASLAPKYVWKNSVPFGLGTKSALVRTAFGGGFGATAGGMVIVGRALGTDTDAGTLLKGLLLTYEPDRGSGGKSAGLEIDADSPIPRGRD
jgi:hypothetical protein